MSSNISAWQRWLPRFGALSATFTTLCCLSVAAAVSLVTAVGATFLTMDAVLQPLLAATLLLTAIGSALTFRAHRNPLPLIITVLSGAWVFLAIFGSALFAQSSDGHGSGHSGGNVWAWSGLAVLIATQLWDLWLVRSRRHTRAVRTT